METAPAEIGRIARQVVVAGSVAPIRTVGVNSQMSGALLEVAVEEGRSVRAGQVLARLDDRELRAQLRAAQTSFTVAEASHERAQELHDKGYITLPEFEREQAAFEAARAQLDQLETRAGYATVRSPIDGLVVRKLAEAGDVVGVQARLFDVADVSVMVVRVSVSELDVVDLAPGDPAQVVLDAYADRTLQGRIRRIFPSADPATRLVPVEVALVDVGPTVARPGFLARVSFDLSPRDGTLLVPAAAIVKRPTGDGVFVVGDGTATLKSVITGVTYGGQVEIVDGLTPGERVVVAGANQLQDGATVRDVSGRNGEESGADSDSAVASSAGGGVT